MACSPIPSHRKVMYDNALRTIFWKAEPEGTKTVNNGGQNQGLQDKFSKKNALLPGKEIFVIPNQSD